MKPLEYYYDAPTIGPDRYPQWFAIIFSALVRFFLKIAFRYRVENVKYLKQLPEGTAYVLAGNHTSYLDPVMMWITMRPRHVRFIAKEEFFQNKLVAWMAAQVGAFPLKRKSADRTAIKRAVKCLKRGEFIGIFPEGTRIRFKGQSRNAHPGVALIAHMGQVPIVPVGISGADRVKPAGTRFIRFPKVVVRYGEPIYLESFQHLPKEERFQAVADEVMRNVYALRDGKDPGPLRVPEEGAI